MPRRWPAELPRTVILGSGMEVYSAGIDRSPADTIRFLTLEELARLFAAVRTSPRDRALFLIAYRHGLRRPRTLRREPSVCRHPRCRGRETARAEKPRVACRPSRPRSIFVRLCISEKRFVTSGQVGFEGLRAGDRTSPLGPVDERWRQCPASALSLRRGDLPSTEALPPPRRRAECRPAAARESAQNSSLPPSSRFIPVGASPAISSIVPAAEGCGTGAAPSRKSEGRP